ncbi:MAG: N-acetyltransferase [Clostridia bacterium]|nr:N-acetyltransferase [Clostridia bacterium]
MTIRTAVPADFDRIMEIYRSAQDFMIASGNPDQWGHFHPSPELIQSDIESGISRVVCDGDVIHGVFVMLFGPDPTYGVIEDGAWLNDSQYVVIHRIASDGTGGVFRAVISCGKSLCDNIRIDTHADNLVMQRHIEESGFVRCGIIHLANGSPRIAYQWTREQGARGL